MKTIITSQYPSILYSTKETAQEDADKFGVKIVKVIHITEWNNKVEKVFIGYGLYDNGKLLTTKDFIFV